MTRSYKKKITFEFNLIDLLWSHKFILILIIILFNIASITFYELKPKRFNMIIPVDIRYDSINRGLVIEEFIRNINEPNITVDKKNNRIHIKNTKKEEINNNIIKLNNIEKIALNKLLEKLRLNYGVFMKINENNRDSKDLVNNMTNTLILMKIIESNQKVFYFENYSFNESLTKEMSILLGNIFGLLAGLLYAIIHKYNLFLKKKKN